MTEELDLINVQKSRVLVTGDDDIDFAVGAYFYDDEYEEPEKAVSLARKESKNDRVEDCVEDDEDEKTNEEVFNEFTLFPKLPIELRFVIWSMHIARNGRLVRPYWKCMGKDTWKWTTQAPIPSILHICQESRSEGLKVYKLMSPAEIRGKRSFESTIYFNSLVDTLYLSEWQTPFPSEVFQRDMREVKSLAFNVQHRDLGLFEGLTSENMKYPWAPQLPYDLLWSALPSFFPAVKQLDFIAEYDKNGLFGPMYDWCDRSRFDMASGLQQVAKKLWGPHFPSPKIRVVEVVRYRKAVCHDYSDKDCRPYLTLADFEDL